MTKTSVQFVVADVSPTDVRLDTEECRQRLSRLLTNTQIVRGSDFGRQVVREANYHPLIAAAALAFKHHLPLTLSPDMIWLTVLQGVAQHTRLHSERLRDQLVPGLKSRIELVVDYGAMALPSNDPEVDRATGEFVAAIHRHLHPQVRELLQADFSTTTQMDRIAGAVALMDACQSYFDYVFYCICGIPSVTLEGTVDDWELLSAKINALHDSDLELSWWTKRLKPLCIEFVQAARGWIDRAHWQNLIKITEIYGDEDLNGWILKFIPYISTGKNRPFSKRNPVLELNKYDAPKENERSITGCISSWLPSGLSQAPVIVANHANGQKSTSDFIAGFSGVIQSDEDQSLRPAIGWTITTGCKIDQLIHQLDTGGHTRSREDFDVFQVFRSGIPSVLWRFYERTGGADIKLHPGISFGEATVDLHAAMNTGNIVDPVLSALDKQTDAGEISQKEYWNQQSALCRYSGIIQIAQAFDESGSCVARYTIGRDPALEEDSSDDSIDKYAILRWSGELKPEGFTQVADNFSDWLESLLPKPESTD